MCLSRSSRRDDHAEGKDMLTEDNETREDESR